VNAVKNGEVYLPYDTGFVFAEVNGDRVYWNVEDDDGSMKAAYVDTNSIGKQISTKEPGVNARLDLTNAYKYREGWCSSGNANVTTTGLFCWRRGELMVSAPVSGSNGPDRCPF